jgi:hypothetical protein
MKRIIIFLISLFLVLSCCGCQSVSTIDTELPTASVITTSPVVETVAITEPTLPWHLQETAIEISKYAEQYGWNDKIIIVMLNWIPDMDMFKSIEQIHEYQFIIYMTDECSYRMTINTKLNEVEAIVVNVDSPTDHDIIYTR